MATEDAYTHASENYPYNIVPQVRSPKPTGSNPSLRCPPDDSQQFIIMDGHNLSVIKGWEWKTNMDLKEFFIPVDNYMTYEFTLKYDGDYTKYITLNYGNMGDPILGVNFVCLFPMYHKTDLEDQTKWKIHWCYLDDPAWTVTGAYNDGYDSAGSSEDETTWRQLGRIMMLNGTVDKPIRPLFLQNRTGYDLPIKLLIGN